MISTISPIEVKRLIEEKGALLVDIRESDEYAREHIEGARLMPLSVFTHLPPATDRERPVVFHCQSGMRSQGNAATLEKYGSSTTYLMEGGLMAWEKAGLPVIRQAVPIPLSRQLQITAGVIITILSVLSFFMPILTWLTLFVGVNLVFAGYTGICFMAKLLQLMPWNR